MSNLDFKVHLLYSMKMFCWTFAISVFLVMACYLTVQFYFLIGLGLSMFLFSVFGLFETIKGLLILSKVKKGDFEIHSDEYRERLYGVNQVNKVFLMFIPLCLGLAVMFGTFRALPLFPVPGMLPWGIFLILSCCMIVLDIHLCAELSVVFFSVNIFESMVSHVLKNGEH